MLSCSSFFRVWENNSITIFWVLLVFSTLKTAAADPCEAFKFTHQTVCCHIPKIHELHALKNYICGKIVQKSSWHTISMSYTQNAGFPLFFNSTMSVRFVVWTSVLSSIPVMTLYRCVCGSRRFGYDAVSLCVVPDVSVMTLYRCVCGSRRFDYDAVSLCVWFQTFRLWRCIAVCMVPDVSEETGIFVCDTFLDCWQFSTKFRSLWGGM